MSKSKHILVLRFSALGDVAMTVPVIRALVEQYPQVQVTVVTRAFFAPLFKNIDNVTAFSADLKGKHKGVLGLWKLSKELMALKINAIADLHNVLRTKILRVFFFGKPLVAIDKGRAEKRALILGKRFEQLKNTHQRYSDVFDALGYTIDMSKVNFPHKASLDQNFLKPKRPNEKIIGVAPFAAFKSKEYPLEHMKKVIGELSKKHHVLLFGGGEIQVKKLNTIALQNTNVTSIAGKFSLSDELDIISNLDLMLSMDSGNGHLAAIYNVPVVSIWGVTHPYAGFYPFHQNLDNALMADREQFPEIPTSVYGNKYPNGYEQAIAEITPEQVVAKIHSVLKS